MWKTSFAPSKLVTMMLCATAGWPLVPSTPALGQDAWAANRKAEFFKLCDVACKDLNKEQRQVYKRVRKIPFYQDSYAVRALAVAYDMTGKKAYLDACKRWSDRMVEFQNGMTPKGAYYMNYGRRPGQDKGNWYSADSACIAMGVLATAVRCSEPKDKQRYLNSVEAFAKLVLDNYVGKGGGITDGLWPEYDGEWYCSSGVFGSLAFLLYDETGNERYRNVALGDVDWLNRLDFYKTEHIGFEKAAPAVIFYAFEAYAPGMRHLKPGTERHKAAAAKIAEALDWMAKNQQGRTGTSRWDYNSQWGSKLGGLPFLLYVFAKHLPDGPGLRSAADKELDHVASLLFKDKKPILSQLAVFAMMSYAERISPGTLFRKSRP